MKKKIYSALIGIGLVSLTLGIWGGVTMYKNRAGNRTDHSGTQ